jgi:hypothetical protein
MPRTPDRPPLSLVSLEATSLAPPRKLGPPGRGLWDRVQREFAIADIGGIELLCADAASPHDRQATSPLKAVLCFGNHTYPFNM